MVNKIGKYIVYLLSESGGDEEEVEEETAAQSKKSGCAFYREEMNVRFADERENEICLVDPLGAEHRVNKIWLQAMADRCREDDLKRCLFKKLPFKNDY